jgi:hypothetical protein
VNRSFEDGMQRQHRCKCANYIDPLFLKMSGPGPNVCKKMFNLTIVSYQMSGPGPFMLKMSKSAIIGRIIASFVAYSS